MKISIQATTEQKPNINVSKYGAKIKVGPNGASVLVDFEAKNATELRVHALDAIITLALAVKEIHPETDQEKTNGIIHQATFTIIDGGGAQHKSIINYSGQAITVNNFLIDGHERVFNYAQATK